MGNVHMEASQINYRGGAKKMSVEEALKEGSGALDPVVIAPEFSATAQYLEGDLVFNDGSLYRFEVDHDPGAWNSEEVMETTIAENLVMYPGDGLHRTIHTFDVKLQSGGGLAFDPNGALYTNVMHNYNTNEQPAGQKWIDGKDIYFRVFSGLSVQMGTVWTDTNIDISSIETIVNGMAIDDAGQLIDSSFAGTSDNLLLIRAPFSGNTIVNIVLYYTKVTV